MTKNTDVWGVTLDNPPTQIPSLFNPSSQIPLTPTDTQKAVTDFENTYPTLAEAWYTLEKRYVYFYIIFLVQKFTSKEVLLFFSPGSLPSTLWGQNPIKRKSQSSNIYLHSIRKKLCVEQHPTSI